MKKLLFLLAFLSTSAFAIDRPIPCTGNSCKLLFETTGSGGAKVSAGNVDGTGAWNIGTSSLSAIYGPPTAPAAWQVAGRTSAGIGSDLTIRAGNGNGGGNGSGILYLGAGRGGSGATTGTIKFGEGQATDGVTGLATEWGVVSNAGAWTLGPSGHTGDHSIRGAIKATRDITVGGATTGGTFIGTYVAHLTPASTTTCSSTCSTQASSNGFVASQAVCLAAWNTTTASTCGDATSSAKFCLCAGLD